MTVAELCMIGLLLVTILYDAGRLILEYKKVSEK